MFPPVTTDEIADRWRPLTDAEQIVAEKRITDAEALLQNELRLRGILSQPDPIDPVWMQLYIRVIADIVKRYLINPDAWLEERDAIDDYDRTRRRDAAVSAGLLYVMPDEVDQLIPRRRPRGAFTIALGQT